MQDDDPTTDAMADGPPAEVTSEEVATPVALEPRADTRPSHAGPRIIEGTDLPVVPGDHEVSAIAQLAVTIAAANTAPKALQNRPNDVFLVLLTARDVGVGLTTAIREFHVIDGKVTLSPKVKLAMVRQQGLGRVWPDPANDGTSATWYAERNDLPGVRHQSTFTTDMATAAGLLPPKDRSAWATYPERMLSWRACGYLLDDVFSEVGTGLYSPDELGAVTDADGEPIIDVVGRADPVPGTSAPRGHNQPPPPDADQADLDALQERIDRLARLPEARQALVALWTKPRAEGSQEPTLPPLRKLKAAQVKTADAMVSSIEQRARKGEWGDWNDGDEPEGEAEPDGDEQPAHEAGTSDVDATTRVVIAEVQGLEPDEVNDQLQDRGIARRGNMDTRRAKLAQAMIAERLGDAPEGRPGDDPEGDEAAAGDEADDGQLALETTGADAR